ncbi:MAG: methylenetetrahydrofolate reductase [Desulfobacterales bacterium]|nr:methylenetetrahydrofolate reductase [Desulfobacterales bacterium]
MHLKCKFDGGEFAVLVELMPPKGTDVSLMLDNAQRVNGVVDAFVVTDMSNAILRMSALCGAMLLQTRGLETVMQICTRDRNRLALQGDLLGANACGIMNVVAITGEDPTFGDHRQARSVHDLDHLDLLYAISGLQNGKDMAGVDLDGHPQFLMGSTVNPGLQGQALELEIEKMNRRYDAGARFFITPPVFELDSIAAFLQRVDYRKYKIIPTMLLIKSLGMARYIDRNLKHVNIPRTLLNRLKAARDKAGESLRIGRELIRTFEEEGFCGVQVSTLGGEDRLAALLTPGKELFPRRPPASTESAAIS